MDLIYAAALGGALLCTSFGQVLYKQYCISGRNSVLIVSLALFVPVPVMNTIALRGIPLSTVYTATCLIHVMVVCLSKWVLRENVPSGVWLGVAGIVAGIIVFNV